MPQTQLQIIKKWMNPRFKFYVNREGSIQERMRFLMEKERMKDEYLGAYLDYIRWGGMNTVMYELGTKGLIGFIQHWMKLNPDLPWADEQPPANFSLPHVNYDGCPKDKKHKGTLVDCGGKTRCAHIDIKRVKPDFLASFSYFDELANLDAVDFYDSEPQNPIPDDAYNEKGDLLPEWNKALTRHQEELKRYKEATEEELRVPCYAVISEGNRVLSLEMILDRINLEPKIKTVYCNNYQLGPCNRVNELNEDEKRNYESIGWCPGHYQENNRTVHPFSGWTLAWYVQKWHEQESGKARVFNKPGEKDFYKAFRNFQVVCD